jgi:hypothetical protein
MRTTSFTIAIAAAFVGLVGSFSTVAVADTERRARSTHHEGEMTRNRNLNRNIIIQRRSYSDNYQYNNSYRRHRGQRGFGFGGISIDLGSNSGCRYSYRKWQATGSRYWRERYYDCVS